MPVTYLPPVQRFDDGSTLAQNADGTYTSTPATDGATTSQATSAEPASTNNAQSLSSAIDNVAGSVKSSVSSALSNLLPSSLNGLLGGDISGALGNLLASSLKAPVPTGIIPNPLHQFASSSYALSLWWMDVQDNNIMTSGDVGTGTNYNPGPNSYVIAEDSGLYPNRRLPTQLGLNYNIQDVNFETVVGLNSKSKSSNMTTGTMTIVEPYGVTFLDSLVRASGMSGTYQNYTEQPYMLQIDFTGYDDNGDPVPSSQTDIYRKRFPIKINTMTIDVTGQGAEYKLSFTPTGHIAYTEKEISTVPKDLTITVDTVGNFFTAFENAINAFWQIEAQDKKTQYPDTIKFNIDPAIAKCTILYNKQMDISQANPDSKKIDLSKGNFSIPAGTQIQEIITRVIQQSDYITGQLGLDKQNDKPSDVQTSESQVLNAFKTTVQTKYGSFDNVTNKYAKTYTYSILQYNVYDAKHPSAPTMTDPRPYVVKDYNYLYTGKNVDILDLKIHFDSTFYTAVNSYPNQVAATNATASTAIDSLLAAGTNLLLSPQLLGSLGVIPGLGQVANLTPNKFKNIVGDQRQTVGLNTIKNPSAQVGANVMNSLYTNQMQEMVNVDLTILGDPTFLKQDDWLYSPNPATGNSVFDKLISQFTMAQQYGQIKMDNGELIVSLTINAPADIDIDWTDKGLMYPPIGSTPSLFTGYYTVKIIKNTFSGGKFTQVLSLVRNSNSDIIKSAAPTNALSRGITGLLQNGLNSLNSLIPGAVGAVGGAVTDLGKSVLGLANSSLGSSASATGDSSASQATFDANGTVNSEYDATRWGEG